MLNPLNYALELAREGIQVFPLKPFSMEPASAEWLAEATTDPAQIRAWWQSTPSANIGIATGATSGLLVIELEGKEGRRWWSGMGLTDSHARTQLPTVPARELLFFRTLQDVVPGSEPAVDVRVLGDGGFTIGLESMLPTGTIRGGLSTIPSADFDIHADGVDGASDRVVDYFDIANVLPELTSTGGSFTDLMSSRTSQPAVSRSRIIREALAAGLGRRGAASAAWWSTAGDSLRDKPDGLHLVWTELEQVERGESVSLDEASRQSRVTLLTEKERTTLAETSIPWFGTRYVEWAEAVSPAERQHRAFLFLLLAEAFAGEAFIPRDGLLLPMDVQIASLSNSPSTHVRARGPLLAVIGALPGRAEWPETAVGSIGDASPPSTTKLMEGDMSAARAWPADSLAEFLWLVDATDDGGAHGLTERQDDGSDTVLGSMPLVLAAELLDARDSVMASLGNPPFLVLMEQDALDRHGAFKLQLSEVIPDRTDVLRLADTVRICASLVALAEGSGVVELGHELVAIEHAEEWLWDLLLVSHPTTVHAYA